VGETSGKPVPISERTKVRLEEVLKKGSFFVSLNEPDHFLSLGVNLNARSFTWGHQESNEIK